MARKAILLAYKDTMLDHIKRQYGVSDAEADRLFRTACKDRYQPMTAIVEETVRPGVPVLKAVDLVSYLDKHSDDLISPSGSIYCQHERKTGATIAMITSKLAERKRIKKEMLAAKAVNDDVKYRTCYFLQTLIKIGVNSLPGNYGSPTSLFYSKGNYNSITSSGRALIGYANTCIEHVIGGNFGWYTIDQLVNHVNIHLGTFDCSKVDKAIANHNMRRVSKDDLKRFFMEELSIYHRYESYAQVDRIVDTLTDSEVQFFWYYQNLRHIMMGNEDIFRPYLNSIFDASCVVDDPSVQPDDLYKLDGDLVTLVNVAFENLVNSGDPEIQVYDLPKKMPDKAIKFVNLANYVQKKLGEIDDLMTAFVLTAMCVPDVENRKWMVRNSSVISDTDSVIFTVKDWVDWYTHDIYSITPATYHIACLMIYLITCSVAHTLKLFSISHGAKGEHIKSMAMKNEFLYPTLFIADIKKTYAGVVTVQEGVILSQPTPDVKGVQLRGSDMCREATDDAEKFIVDDILLASLHRKLNGHELIQHVMDLEQRIYADISSGNTNWCEPLAIKEKEGYKTPLSSNYLYYLVWQEVFAWKYGDIQLPTKAITIPLAKNPSKEYFEYLKKTSPKIASKLNKFLATYNKFPSKIALAPVCSKIPKELIPLTVMRDIIHKCTGPHRLALKTLGIDCVFTDDKILFTEVYGKHDILSLPTQTTKDHEET